MKKSIYLISLFIIIGTACTQSSKQKEGHDHQHVNDFMNKRSFEDLVQRFESPERTEYQQPQKVIQYLGDISSDTILDLGAGTGYFTFKMAMQNAYVIAADVDQRFLTHIDEKRYKLGLPDGVIETRKVPFDNPALTNEEVNKVIVVNTYHHINDRPTYFSKVKNGLKDGGALYIIDFMKKKDGIGPPKNMRIEASQVIVELKQAGYSDIQLNDSLLEHQYVIKAIK